VTTAVSGIRVGIRFAGLFFRITNRYLENSGVLKRKYCFKAVFSKFFYEENTKITFTTATKIYKGLKPFITMGTLNKSNPPVF